MHRGLPSLTSANQPHSYCLYVFVFFFYIWKRPAKSMQLFVLRALAKSSLFAILDRCWHLVDNCANCYNFCLEGGGVRGNLPSLLVRPGLPFRLSLRVSPWAENKKFNQTLIRRLSIKSVMFCPLLSTWRRRTEDHSLVHPAQGWHLPPVRKKKREASLVLNKCRQ